MVVLVVEPRGRDGRERRAVPSLTQDRTGRPAEEHLLVVLEDLDLLLSCLRQELEDGREVLAVTEAEEAQAREVDTAEFLDRLQQGSLFSFDVESMIREAEAPAEVVAEAIRIYQDA